MYLFASLQLQQFSPRVPVLSLVGRHEQALHVNLKEYKPEGKRMLAITTTRSEVKVSHACLKGSCQYNMQVNHRC